MRKPLGIPLAILVIAIILGAFSWRTLRSPEPAFQGKPLTGWLKERREGQSQEAENAIRQIGTNALPTLLAMARATNSNAQEALLRLVHRQSALVFHLHSASEDRDLAACGFGVLGPIAKGAVPALTNLVSDPDPDLRRTAIGCLGSIGPAAQDAVPALIPEMSDTNRLVRAWAKLALGNIHGQPAITVPALIANLSRRDGNTHLTVLALSKFGGEAKAAVPALLPLLNDPNSYIRSFTSNALKQIDREAATQAGVK